MDTDQAHGWAVTIEAAGPPGIVTDDALADLAQQLHVVSGVVSGRTDGSRYGATFSLDDDDQLDVGYAAERGARVFRAAAATVGLPPLPIVRLEVLTYAEQDAELARPNFPELIGVAELAEILGVSRQRASQIQATAAGFPAPVAHLRAGPVWTRPSIGNFLQTWTRKPGRPSASVLDGVTVEEAAARIRESVGRAVNAAENAEARMHESVREAIDGAEVQRD